jgi:hypothetical protein
MYVQIPHVNLMYVQIFSSGISPRCLVFSNEPGLCYIMSPYGTAAAQDTTRL